MAAPIQSPTKCEVRFLNAKGERPAEIHKQIVAIYGNVMNRQNVTDERRSGRPSLISDDFAFGGALDRRCHFKHVSLKQSRFYHCQTSTVTGKGSRSMAVMPQ
jgi:hypothetical protein